ncbi:MAG TPA: hypothetical protein VNR51_07545 [Hyphomicrobium sp.]|nr:hypothetical protein [Hyphomicrobium sp.]
MQTFPDLRWQQIAGKAKHMGLRRPRRKLSATGHALVDCIRERAFDLRLSMVDLDAMAKTKKYFQKAAWQSGSLNRKALLRAIEALGGEVSIRWESVR